MDHTSPIVSLEQRRGAMMLRDYRNHLRAAGRAEGTVTQRLLHLDHLSRRVPLLAASEQDLVDYLASKRDTHSAEARKSMRSPTTKIPRLTGEGQTGGWKCVVTGR